MVHTVLTGGPGVGKTTLLLELQRRGFQVVGESAREVIQQRKAAGLPPRPDAVAFARQVFARDEHKYKQHTGRSDPVFFDRSAVESLGMLHSEGGLGAGELQTALNQFSFHKTVFVLPPWPQIYTQDDERDHSFEHCVRVHEDLLRWYRQCGYAVHEVPCLPVGARADHVLNNLNKLQRGFCLPPTRPPMLFDPNRHQPLKHCAWDEARAAAAIEWIVRDTEARFTVDNHWPLHAEDRQSETDTRLYETSLYDGTCGVLWALGYLHAVGAVQLQAPGRGDLPDLLARNRAQLGDAAQRNRASYLLGDTPIQLLGFGRHPTRELELALDELIAGNTEHPARELMTGAPGTMLAALFLHEKTGAERWADLFRLTASRLWSQLEWSAEFGCAYWTQQFDRRPSTYLDAVHGFVATVVPLSRGRHLLPADEWASWQACIVNTVQRTVDREGAHANWRPQLNRTPDAGKKLLQFCHGAPGFVICLADLEGAAIDSLLLAAGETTWAAGPLRKGSNLCHGTAGNGYAFLKLYRRTNDVMWLQRARAFAMHAIGQAEAEAQLRGQLRYSLWTGDLGLAVYLWDCMHGEARFPTLDVFYAPGCGA